MPNPCGDEIVRLALERMNRPKSRPHKQAERLNHPNIDRMLAQKVDGSNYTNVR